MLNRVFVGALSLALAGGPALAQQVADRPSERGFAAFLSLGAEGTDWGALNDELTRTGFAEIESARFAIGGGGYVLLSRVLLGGEMYAGIGNPSASGSGREARAIGGGGFFTLGYALADRPSGRVYPLLGVGGVGVILDLQDPLGVGIGPNVNDPQFVDVMVNPGRRSQLTAGGLALLFGAGAEVLVGRRVNLERRRESGLLVGVRGGYVYTPVRSDWMLYNQRITGGPDAVGGGWFVRLSVGAGGTRWRSN